MSGWSCLPVALLFTGFMLSRAFRTKFFSAVLACVLLVVTVVVWRGWTARVPVEKALRSELELRAGVLYRAAAALPFEGLIVEDWRAGQRRVEVTIGGGRAHGLSRGWYENGQIEVEEHFVHGVSHGTRTRWFAEGGKKSQVEIRQGQLSGTFREWHPNGQLARETPLRNGVAHGEVKSWDVAGKLTGTAQVSHGQKVAE